MVKESPGFFERLTGARIMSQDDDIDEQDVILGNEQTELPKSEADNDNEEYFDEAIDEPETETDDSYADEDAVDAEEQEGQLTVDVFQDDSNVIIQSTIAGVSPDDLDVSITNDMVTIRGERRQTYNTDAEDYFYQECYWGSFSRSIILPIEIDADRAEAKIKNGILTIRIPKANAAMTRKLKVKAT